MTKDIKMIKEKYGEEFANKCNHSSIFQILTKKYPGLLYELISSIFGEDKNLYSYIDGYFEIFEGHIKEMTIKKIGKDIFKYETVETEKSVEELLAEKGYEIYECTTDGEKPASPTDIQYYKRYYRPGEVICTIYNGGRLHSARVFFIVKKDLEKIKPLDKPPKDEKTRDKDPYSTSVMSIQFYRNVNKLDIISRYNHSVNNPNSVHRGNLEKIAEGLTKAFERQYNLKAPKIQSEQFYATMRRQFVKAKDGKLYKYNRKVNGIAYCSNNIIIDYNIDSDGEVIKLPKERYILIENFIIDKKEKKVFLYDKEISKSFIDAFSELNLENPENVKILEENDKKTKTKTIRIQQPEKKEVIIKINKLGRLISYDNPNIQSIGDYFCNNYVYLINLNIPNVKTIGNHFCVSCENLTNIKLPYRIKTMSAVNTPISSKYIQAKDGYYYKINTLKDGIAYCSNNIIIDYNKDPVGEVINLPKERYILIDYFIIDKLEKRVFTYDNTIKDSFTDAFQGLNTKENVKIIEKKDENTGRKTIIIQQPGEEDIIIETNEDGEIISYENKNITTIGDDFCSECHSLGRINIPNVKIIGNNFCNNCDKLIEINAENLETIGDSFCCNCSSLERINLPKVKTIGNNFCNSCDKLIEINAKNLETIGDYCCSKCHSLERINLPKIKTIGNNFCSDCDKLIEINAENLETIGNSFCCNCFSLERLNLPKIKTIGNYFCNGCDKLTEINAKNLETIGNSFCYNCSSLERLNLPKVKTIGNYFCNDCDKLTEINAENLETIDDSFCRNCSSLERLNLPKVKTIGNIFCTSCGKLTEINAENLETIGNSFCYNCSSLERLNLPKVKTIGNYFCNDCDKLTEINAENLETIRDYFCHNCSTLERINLPKVKTIGNFFCNDCDKLTEINAENLETIRDYFCHNCSSLERINLPKLKEAGSYFLNNRRISELYQPQATKIMDVPIESSQDTLKKVYAPKLMSEELGQKLNEIAKKNNKSIINLKIYKIITKFKLIKEKLKLKIIGEKNNEETRNNRSR